jgi:hypothetical protein
LVLENGLVLTNPINSQFVGYPESGVLNCALSAPPSAPARDPNTSAWRRFFKLEMGICAEGRIDFAGFCDDFHAVRKAFLHVACSKCAAVE